MTKAPKVLVFEGAGCAWMNGVSNCRIRTAFHNDDGKQIYLEIEGYVPNKSIKSSKHWKGMDASCWPAYGIVMFAHEITGNGREKDDCNESRFDCERNDDYLFEYTEDNILKFVNDYFGCSFDSIHIDNVRYGYGVHADAGEKNAYHYCDDVVNAIYY